MNALHGVICSSGWWARTVERELLPWALRDLELGERVLEIGPGFGATTRVLAERPGELVVLELEPRYCEHLRRTLGDRARVVQGDATRMPFEDGAFSGVVCFTMLHHLPSTGAQDRLLAEAARVLEPGGTFAGSDSLGTGAFFKALHIADTLVRVDPQTLAGRLERTGLRDARVEPGGRSFRFRARKPEPTAA